MRPIITCKLCADEAEGANGVGMSEGDFVGDFVGPPVVGSPVVGRGVCGEPVGKGVGDLVVGAKVGIAVGCDVGSEVRSGRSGFIFFAAVQALAHN
mmetsp:Transcript_14221/g.40813  ORF Transcript_14221/g.40813 Transcript_14221/m.40813 type:complete len:96 (-) Transcript_14221:962-1249(-)